MSQLVVGFDFDGTLYHTNEIKKKAFFSISSKFDRGEILMDKILSRNPILDRYGVFDLFSKEYKLLNPKSKSIILA